MGLNLWKESPQVCFLSSALFLEEKPWKGMEDNSKEEIQAELACSKGILLQSRSPNIGLVFTHTSWLSFIIWIIFILTLTSSSHPRKFSLSLTHIHKFFIVILMHQISLELNQRGQKNNSSSTLHFPLHSCPALTGWITGWSKIIFQGTKCCYTSRDGQNPRKHFPLQCHLGVELKSLCATGKSRFFHTLKKIYSVGQVK